MIRAKPLRPFTRSGGCGSTTCRPTPRDDRGALPPIDIEAIWRRFCSWNGDEPAPSISHRAYEGTLRVVLSVPLKTVKVYWNDKLLGHDDFRFGYVARNIALGNYDRDAGTKLSDIIPPSPADWNGF